MSKASITTAQPIWDFLSGNSQPRRTAAELYGRVVTWARAPWFYSDLGVPDTPEGRLELILLHVTLMLHRLKADGPAAEPTARALAEAFVTDMDDCLREMGVGDMTVAKKVKKAAAALFDRARDYGAALAADNDDKLVELIADHLVDAGNPGSVQRLAAYARDCSARFAGCETGALAGVQLQEAGI